METAENTTLTETQDAGAVPVTQSAETVSNQGEATSGADTHTATAEGQANQANETDTSESAQGATEGTETGRQPHQKTLEERVQELAEKRIAEVETKLTAKLEAVTQAKTEEKPNFYEIDFDKVNEHFRQTMEQIEELKLDGKFLEAMELQDGLTSTRQLLKQNEASKADYIRRMNERSQTEQQTAQINQQITAASELVAKEHGIAPEVWKKAEEWFVTERQSKPLLDAQYREKVMLQGPIAGLLWAKEYIEKNMGKKEQELIDKKEAAKTSLPPGKTSSGVVAGNANLSALREKAKSGNADDLARYMAEKSKPTT